MVQLVHCTRPPFRVRAIGVCIWDTRLLDRETLYSRRNRLSLRFTGTIAWIKKNSLLSAVSNPCTTLSALGLSRSARWACHGIHRGPPFPPEIIIMVSHAKSLHYLARGVNRIYVAPWIRLIIHGGTLGSYPPCGYSAVEPHTRAEMLLHRDLISSLIYS